MENVENPGISRHLEIGQLSVDFEPSFTMLRNICWSGQEVLRAIYVAVRDANWNTVLPSLSNLEINSTVDTLRLTFNARCHQDEIDFSWQGTIELLAVGRLTFFMLGTALSDFRKNRIGFCILHPAECAGLAAEVHHVDGSAEHAAFPKWISPHQPFKSMRAISHSVAGHLRTSVRMEGDVFEMEDQRNWTDASFKTYCTPLENPFPVEVCKGHHLSQSVGLKIECSQPNLAKIAPSARSDVIEICVRDRQLGRVPPLGLAVASHREPLKRKEIDRLRSLRLSHLRVDLHLASQDWRAQLQQAEIEAIALGAKLELAVFITEQASVQLAALATVLHGSNSSIARMFVFHEQEKSTTGGWVEIAKRLFKSREHVAFRNEGESFAIGAGTNIYFTELNRFRPPISVAECVTYSINPQVHAFDDASLVETLSMQGFTVQSARQFCGDLPIYVGPVTLRPRFNPNATGPAPAIPNGELPAQVDPRQTSLFAAAWTLASLKYLAEAGAAGITFYETTGMRGVMDAEQGHGLPAKFSSIPGGVFPLYHPLADVAQRAGDDILECTSFHPLRVVGLALTGSPHDRLLLGNLSPVPQSIRIDSSETKCFKSSSIVVRQHDRDNLAESTLNPEHFRIAAMQRVRVVDGQVTLTLPPHAYCCLDWQSSSEVNHL